MGKTILVSSHILPELADICNKIGIIEQGCLLVNGEVSEVMKQVRTDIVLNVAVAERLTDAAGMLENQPEVESVQDKNGVLIVKLNEGVSQYGFLANRLVEQGLRAHPLQGRRDQPRDRVHAPDQGNHELTRETPATSHHSIIIYDPCVRRIATVERMRFFGTSEVPTELPVREWRG